MKQTSTGYSLEHNCCYRGIRTGHRSEYMRVYIYISNFEFPFRLSDARFFFNTMHPDSTNTITSPSRRDEHILRVPLS